MNAIQQLDDNTFYLESRGNKMTLRRIHNCFGEWEMMTNNASVRAYRTPGVKYFDDLAQVEKQYKSWRGISALIR